MRKIILATSSPRRHEIFARADIPFEAEDSGYEEDLSLPLPPRRLVARFALEKARASAQRHPDAIAIGFDTVVVLEGKIFGKPKDKGEARTMLAALSGRAHSILTGFAIVDGMNKKEITRVEETAVTFRGLSPSEIDAYVDSN